MSDTEEPVQEQPRTDYLDKDGKPIPLYKNDEGEDGDKTKKKDFKIGLPVFLVSIALIVLLTSITPLYSILMRITPPSWHGAVLKHLYQSTPLKEEPYTFDEPMELPMPESGKLPVLSFDTGICFSFYATLDNPDPSLIGTNRLQDAKKGKAIAEILAVGEKDKYEYRVESTSYRETIDKDYKTISIVCQKFGRAYGNMPENINALYIRPITPFRSNKTVWKSIKHLYDDYSSPLEPNRGNEPL